MAPKIVGIDIGAYAAKAVVLERGRSRDAINLVNLGLATLDTQAILNWETDPLPAEKEIGNAIKNLIKVHKIKAKHISTSLSGDAIIIKKIQLPFTTDDELKASIAMEAEQYIPYSINDVNIDYHVLSRDTMSGHMNVLLVAARKDIIQSYLKAISEAKLRPGVIDVDALALFNTYNFLYPGSEEDVILVDIGAQTLHVNILSDGQPLLIKEEHIGCAKITEELSEEFDVPLEVAEAIKIGAEPAPDLDIAASIVERVLSNWMVSIERAIETVRSEIINYKPSAYYLAGGGTHLKGLVDEFKKNFQTPVHILNPLLSVNANPKKFNQEYLKYIGPQMAVSFGLALRKVD